MGWEKLKEIYLDELVKLTQDNYPNFNEIPKKFIRRIFKTYWRTTFVFFHKDKIKGFAIYQEWLDVYNVIMLYLPFSKQRNLRIILQGRNLLKNKPLVWYDEKRMEGRGFAKR